MRGKGRGLGEGAQGTGTHVEWGGADTRAYAPSPEPRSAPQSPGAEQLAPY